MTIPRRKFLLLATAIILGGCAGVDREPPRPGNTTFAAKRVVLPAEILDNHIIVTAKWDKYGPYRFMVDTGSNVTLVTPELADRYPDRYALLPDMPQVQVRSADGGTASLAPAVVSRIELGKARFDNIPVLVYDCRDISDQLGVKIDGILGFPLFRDALLTLDYPHSRVVLEPASAEPPPGGSAVSFDNADKSPIVPVRLGDRSFPARLDSGLDEPMMLNPAGLVVRFAYGPVEGPTVGTLTGDHVEQLGRLDADLMIGDYAVPHPVVEVVGEPSSIGAGILKYFTITFDQERGRVTFRRDATDPIAVPGRRSTGLSFRKAPAYWKVVGVVRGSPADAAGAQTGDLIVAINDEPVFQWDTRRYGQLLANSGEVTYTFLNGTAKTEKTIKVADLVP